MDSYRIVDTQDNKVNDVISPRLAAIGVATLSGLIWQYLDKIITPAVIKPNTRLAIDTVTKLLAHKRYA